VKTNLPKATRIFVGILIGLVGLSIAASAFSVWNDTDWFRFTNTEINLIAIGLFACGASLVANVLLLARLSHSPVAQRWRQVLHFAIVGSILLSFGLGKLLRTHARSASEAIQHQLQLLDAATQQYEIDGSR